MTLEAENGDWGVGVFGPVASGKTFLLKQWVQSLNRVVIFDSTQSLVRTYRFKPFEENHALPFRFERTGFLAGSRGVSSDVPRDLKSSA